ncbi:dienelactone hydrolase family protein [Salsipaludibacter albus]|uniref:dienelactone hydrolase family protein n=1 Tax=Salsipaludibacter albus TaxID=2849650 RepID=UPI001EE4CCBB|nr:dienelactone hydrolase family protein [Salsipaludibacter albus]MBY5163129.1 dienelactone hydrolase family protein [Salsipaludibacter albus]
MGDEAYFVGPPERPGPGVLFLPSWWGLTSAVKARADGLADAGATVLVPDLNFGARPESEEAAEAALGAADPNRLASMVLSSADLLAGKSAGERLAVVGVGMGGSLGLWLSVRRPDLVDRVVSLYGSQSIDFAGADAAYQLHFADTDRFISADDRAFLEATMRMEDLAVDVVVHPGTRHGFADPEGPTHDPEAASAAWDAVSVFVDRD